MKMSHLLPTIRFVNIYRCEKCGKELRGLGVPPHMSHVHQIHAKRITRVWWTAAKRRIAEYRFEGEVIARWVRSEQVNDADT
jgi:hypothetical protein